MKFPDIQDSGPFFFHLGCQGVFLAILVTCLFAGWLGGSQGHNKGKKVLSKLQVLKIRTVFGFRMDRIKKVATNVVIEQLKDGW